MSRFLVGAYSADMGGTAEGIVSLVSRADGTLENAGLVASLDSPSYLLGAKGVVYAALEGVARVEAFDARSLAPLGDASAGGSYPCHLSRFGDTTIASCYGSGTLGVLSSAPLALTDTLQGLGNGPHPAQEGPHAHSTFSLDGATVFSADLGADRVNIHSLVDGILTQTGSFLLPAGTGPRDFRLHPSGRVFLLGELSLEVLELAIDGDTIAIVDTVRIPGAEDGDHAAEISLSDDGAFAFVGLRGSNRISTLAVDSTLTALGWVDCGGNWPRHHIVDGEMLHVANQLSNSVTSFTIQSDGALAPVGQPTPVASPTFILRLDLELPETLVK
jgi:6-phosphogluconolactonase (cycloisomerase 2 family)